LQLEIAGKGVDMIAEILDSANVQNCGHELTPPEDGGVSLKKKNNK
jgi:hypothetical protein